MTVVLWILGILILLVLLVSLLTVLISFRRRRRSRAFPRQLLPYRHELDRAAAELRGLGLKHLYCKSGRCRLHALYFEQSSDKCAILLHGIGGRGQDRFLDAKFYLDRGYSLLFPDLRGNGSSRGRWQGVGQFSRTDLLCWTEMMVRKLGPELRIVLDGTGMGAAAALMFAGDGRERNLCAVVSDSAFSDAGELLRYRLRSHYLPDFLLWPPVRVWGRLLMGYDLKKASPAEALAHCRVPVLFLHGEQDEVVPCYMVRRLSAACASSKLVLTVPGARHMAARTAERPLCEQAIDEFLSRWGL